MKMLAVLLSSITLMACGGGGGDPIQQPTPIGGNDFTAVKYASGAIVSTYAGSNGPEAGYLKDLLLPWNKAF